MAASDAAPVSEGKAEPRLAASSGDMRSWVSPASFSSSQRRNPGIGDRVAKVFRLRNSADSSSTTRLIRKLPKLMPDSPCWQLLIE